MRAVRPHRVSRRALALVAFAAGFFMISRTTGSGWVVVLLCGVIALLLAGIALPAICLGRAKIRAQGPRDATVGLAAVLRVSVRRGRGLRLRPVDPPGEWLAADAPAQGDVLVRPARRGVFGEIEVEVTTGAPLGLVWWRRRLRVALARPVEVGPRPLEVPLTAAAPPTLPGGEARLRGRLGHESMRGVREYAPGDPVRLVHWLATAHWGDLMVKELESSDAPRVTIVVDLRGPQEAAELAASRVGGLARAALQAGFTVTMLTAERGGPAVGDVPSATEAGRRLARAVAGTPAESPVPVGSTLMRVTASEGPETGEDRKRR